MPPTLQNDGSVCVSVARHRSNVESSCWSNAVGSLARREVDLVDEYLGRVELTEVT
jgi:hypothetical protein